MSKKYYVAPATEHIVLHVESNILAGSVDGFKGQLTDDFGSEELTNKKGWDCSDWSDNEE